MKKKESEFTREKRIESEATQWVARKFSGFSPSDQDAFFEWLAADPSHSEAYVKYQELWGRMDTLAEWAPEHSEKPHRDLLKDRHNLYRFIWLGGIAAALALGAFLWLPEQLGLQIGDRQHYVASAYESHQLSDGSIVEMNSGAAMVVNFTPKERRVELVSSEALFTVAKDKNRPFIVTAKGIEVRAIGTAFNVRVSESEVEVLVTEGKVRLDTSPTMSSFREAASELAPIVESLVAGQRSRVILQSEFPEPVVEHADAEQILEELDWKYRLEFDSIPLADAVDQINRRSSIELVIVDSELEELPIVATLRIDNMDYFADILEVSFGIDTEIDSRGRMLLKKADDSL